VTRVESSHYLSQHDSSRVRVTKNRYSSRVIDSSHAITDFAKEASCVPKPTISVMNFYLSQTYNLVNVKLCEKQFLSFVA